jgi:hypothetical protein
MNGIYYLYLKDMKLFFRYQVTMNSKIIKTGYRFNRVTAENAAVRNISPNIFSLVVSEC